MAIIDWDDERFILGVEEMDNTHIEFVDLVNCMANAPDTEFVHLFDQLLEHTRAHFDTENRMMVLHGFPATVEHNGEHRRVLNVGLVEPDDGMVLMVSEDSIVVYKNPEDAEAGVPVEGMPLIPR